MGWLKDVYNKQKEVIKDVQNGAEHAVNEASDEVAKATKTINEEQQKFLKELQEGLEEELRIKYNHSVHHIYDRIVIILIDGSAMWQIAGHFLDTWRDEILKRLEK